MNYNFLPDKVKKVLSSIVGSKMPVSLVRASASADGTPGEGYIIGFDDKVFVFSRGLGQDEFSVYRSDSEHGRKPILELRKDGINGIAEIKLPDRTLSMKISGFEEKDFISLRERLKNSSIESASGASDASQGNRPEVNAHSSEIPEHGVELPKFSQRLALAVALMHVAIGDREIQDEENRYIVNMFKDSPALLKEAHSIYKSMPCEQFFDLIAAHDFLERQQKLCILANMIEIAMIDGAYHSTEQRVVELFMDRCGVSRGDFDAILSTLLVKNDLSAFS